jgi:hypothetical protein
MMLRGIASLLLTALFTLPTMSLLAQSPADDSILYKKAVDNLIALYQQSSGDQTGLYNGSQYSGYPFVFAEGHPFFKDNKPGTGSIVYDNVLYENVLLQFDEVQDVMILDSASRRIQLLNDRITRFTLYNNNFIRIIKDSSNIPLVRTGFYNILYDGNTSLLKKEEKIVREDVTTGVLLRFVDINKFYYIKRNNVYYSIQSKKSMLAFFKDRKKEIRQYIRKNKLSYRKDRDNTLTKVTAYYNQLTK